MSCDGNRHAAWKIICKGNALTPAEIEEIYATRGNTAQQRADRAVSPSKVKEMTRDQMRAFIARGNGGVEAMDAAARAYCGVPDWARFKSARYAKTLPAALAQPYAADSARDYAMLKDILDGKVEGGETKAVEILARDTARRLTISAANHAKEKIGKDR
jgi:hypothetical protein